MKEKKFIIDGSTVDLIEIPKGLVKDLRNYVRKNR